MAKQFHALTQLCFGIGHKASQRLGVNRSLRLEIREARDIEPMRLEISKRKRAHHLKIAEVNRDVIAYNKILSTMNGKIAEAPTKGAADATCLLARTMKAPFLIRAFTWFIRRLTRTGS